MLENTPPHIGRPDRDQQGMALPELLAAVAEGDEGAFARLLRIYGDTIYGQAMAYCKSVEVAEEMVQDVFMRVWRNREKLVEIESFENWLFIVARNLIFDGLQKRVNQPLVATVPADLLAEHDSDTPDLRAEYRDSYRHLMKGIEQLPEKRQRVFRMSRIEGMTHEQIAQELGIHKDTVSQYIVLSLSYLKEYLGRHTGNTLLVIILLRGLP